MTKVATNSVTLTEYTLARPGGQLCYWLAGAANAPLVVLTHGAAMDHRMFTAQVEILADRYRLLLWVVPAAAHNAHQENPDFFNRILLDFLVGIRSLTTLEQNFHVKNGTA